jgi:TetR/AcrR family transcriptional repressor of nem operon
MEVFASRGYSNTSIDDVVKATGVSRYGIYGTFGNKRELFEQALEKYTERMGKASFMRLLEPDSSIAHIRDTFEARLDHMCACGEQSGCLVIFTAMELAPRDKDIEMVLNCLLTHMSEAYACGLKHAREKGEIKEDLDLEQAGQFLTGAFFGLSVMARCGFTKDSLQAFVDSTIAAVAR